MSHATGFHGVVWRPVARRLVDAGMRVYSVDYRGHGDSDAPDAEYHWDDFGRDALAALDHLGIAGGGDLVGVGHSKGSAALVLAEDVRPRTFAHLWLYEPIIMAGYESMGPSRGNSLAEGARRRRMVWDSPEEAYASFASRPPFDALDPDALAAYVEHGMRPLDDGTWEIKCRGEIEARVYEMGSAHAAFDALPRLGCPTVVVCGEHTNAIPPDYGRFLAQSVPGGRFELAEGLGHFGPLEDPAWAAASILALARA
jgi:pimeloyl-ACP methyl ester carboxylesterase